ncbi:MAG: Stage II sporulation protein E [uncultured Phycisphaerae bacterium]|uniref:Stage II sporulation protein E n=1 Tax=uncultured Phycisphaerae bacterium TaxID=904963 RepID=A0A6J4NCD3_9BACT|nr:MAG: Stage II sporulation protein E [uncultured Phycisphaerae bacterium]
MTQVFTFSQPGGHPNNEDAFAVRRHPADADAWICCLADGQGGRAGGGRAAQLACQVAADGAAGLSLGQLSRPTTWCEVLRASDLAVRDDASAGFTTLIGFYIAGGFIAGASCGDSAVLLAPGGGRPSELTANQVKAPPVGSGGAPFCPFGAGLPGSWKVLAVSDGVWKYAGWDRVRTAASSLSGQALIDDLRSGATLPGSGQLPDDFTAVLFESTNEPKW